MITLATKKLFYVLYIIILFFCCADISFASSATELGPSGPPPTDWQDTPTDTRVARGVFLPVNDRELNDQFYDFYAEFIEYSENFDEYRLNFNDYWADMQDWIEEDTDSLKNLIGGSNPEGIASLECANILIDPAPYNDKLSFNVGAEDPNDYDNGTVATTANMFLEINSIDAIYVNNSASLRCLLQELVEWKKLDLNLKIHSMMKNFINDAQAYLFSKQMQSYIVAGLVDWSESGIEQQLSDNLTVDASVYAGNLENEKNKRAYSIRHGAISRTLGNLDGFELLDIIEPFRIPIATDLAASTLDVETFEIDLLPSQLNNTLDQEFDLSGTEVEEALAGEFPGWAGYKNLVLRDENNPITILDMAEFNLLSQVGQMKIDQYTTMENGWIDSVKCIDPDDPWCRLKEVITPAFINAETVSHTVENVGFGALTQTDEPGENPSDTAQAVQTNIIDTISLRDYDTEDLRMKSPDFNALYKEFFAEFNTGYYDIDIDTRVWGQNSLTNITDEYYYQMIDRLDGTFGPLY